MIVIDFETYSELDIKQCGAFKYSCHPSTEILCMGFSIGHEVFLWTPNDKDDTVLNKLFTAIEMGLEIIAHNVSFDGIIWKNIGVKNHNFPEIPERQWRCSQALSRFYALPAKLKEVAEALNLAERKDDKGKSLLKLLSRPRKPTKTDLSTRCGLDKYKDKYNELYEYCKQDILTTKELYKVLTALPYHKQELAIWRLDQKINRRGVPLDMEAVNKVIDIIEDVSFNLIEETENLTGGEISSVNRRQAIIDWCAERGVELKKFDKAYITETLADKDLPDDVRRILEIRQKASKTSLAKYPKMVASVHSDNRVRDNMVYHGASTGRWAGELVQFQNLPRGGIKDMDSAIEFIKSSSIEEIKSAQSNLTFFLSGAIRGMIQAEEGKDLIVVDYNAIEARVVAWLSGQNDLVNAFKNNVKVYEKQAAITYGKRIEDIQDPSIERSVGKELVLACGYGMGPDKFQARCKAYGIELSDEFAKNAVDTYRKTNSMIVKQWYAQEKAATLCTDTGNVIKEGKITWSRDTNFLYCQLPSGRKLSYYKPSADMGETPWGGEKYQLSFYGQKNIKGKTIWCRQRVYGGLLVENICQAIARDIMAEAMLRCETAGYPIILSIHDELIAEVDKDFGSVEEFGRIMCTLPAWASGLPLSYGGWRGKRYKK